MRTALAAVLAIVLTSAPAAASSAAEQEAFLALAKSDVAARVLTPAACDDLASAYESPDEPRAVKDAALALLRTPPCARPQVARLSGLQQRPQEADAVLRTLSVLVATDRVAALLAYLETDRLLRDEATRSPLRSVVAWSCLRGRTARRSSLAHASLKVAGDSRARLDAVSDAISQAFALVDPVTVSARLERSVRRGFVTQAERAALEDLFAANAHPRWHWVALARRGAATSGQVAKPPATLDLDGFLSRAVGS